MSSDGGGVGGGVGIQRDFQFSLATETMVFKKAANFKSTPETAKQLQG